MLNQVKPITLRAFDPGLTTGFCEFVIKGEQVVMTKIGQTKHVDYIVDIINAPPEKDSTLVILYESFTLRLIEANLAPVEVIGVIKYVCEKQGHLIKSQAPHQRLFADKRFSTHLKGIPSDRNTYAHAKDAIRHAFVYMYFDLAIHKLPVLSLDRMDKRFS